MPFSRTAPPPPSPPPAYPRHSSNGSRRSRANSSTTDVRLSIIIEDGDLPSRPDKAHFHLPFGRSRWTLIDDPPRPSFDRSPPKYSLWDATGPKGERLWQVRENKYVRGKGGWRRMTLIVFIVAAVVALVVGLAVGLTKTDKRSANPPIPSPSASSSPTSPSKTGPFPAGSYTFTTYLNSVTTNCTSDSANWQCFPYHTYSESPSQAIASYQWVIIDSGSPSSPNLTISSSDNPFNVMFANASLTLLDAGLDSERYRFATKFEKEVPLPQGINCYFNNTTLEGTLYTKRAKSSGPAQPSASSSIPTTGDIATDIFAEWRYAVETTQSIGCGSTVPECFHMKGRVKGARFSNGITPQASDDFCRCVYKNYNL